jgi:hypothetical protein
MACLVGLQRRRKVALRPRDVADARVAGRERELPLRICGLGLGGALGGGAGGAVARQRGIEVAARRGAGARFQRGHDVLCRRVGA